MEKIVANLGGVFLYTEKPKELAEWYKETLGLNFENYNDTYYTSWPYQAEDKKSMSIFSIMKVSERPTINELSFRINFRVLSMDATKKHFENKGIAFAKEPEYFDGEGWFAWIEDPEGNSIELWEDGFKAV